MKTQASNDRPMRKTDGTLCRTPEQNADVFREHFQTLYNRQPVFDASVLHLIPQQEVYDGYDHAPTSEEIRKATWKLKEKGPGDSGITAQIWKAIVENEQTFRILECIITDFWESETPPEDWQKGLLKILPKKGDLSLPGNYRGIMLLETSYKILAIILHDRLRPIAEGLDHEAQCGFRPQRGCADGIFTIKMAMKKRREHGLETWILFLDLVKAFDRVPRQLLWLVLEKLGVPVKLIHLLQALHANVTVKFVINEVTNTIECTIGVKQGDILGPLLFIFYLAAVMMTWRSHHPRPLCIFRTRMDDVLTGRRYNTKKGEEFALPDSEYADDTAVLFTSRESLESSIPLLLTHFAKFGLEIHVGTPQKASKSVILFVAAPNRVYTVPETFDACNLESVELGDGVYIPIVDRFVYLGSVLTRDCKDNADVEARINSASHAFGSLRKCLFTSTKISFDVKKTVYEGLILAILLYGAEHWCLTEKLFSRLRIFHSRCVRAMCRVSRLHTRTHHIRTSDLLERVGLLPIDAYITRRQLRWLGHVTRMGSERLPRKMLTSWIRERRPRGAPDFTYGRGMYKALKKVDVDRKEWFEMAMDRVKWRNVLQAA